MQKYLKHPGMLRELTLILIAFTDSTFKISDYSIGSVHSETLAQCYYYKRCLILSVIRDTPLCLRSNGALLFSG